MTKSINLAAFLAAVFAVAVFFAAWLFRFEPIPEPGLQQQALWIKVWDRWNRRACLVLRPEFTNLGGTACTRSEIDSLLARLEGEQANRNIAARSESEEQRQTREQKQRFAEIVGDASSGAAKIANLRAARFSEQQIANWATDLRSKMINSGAPKKMIDEYFGGDPYAAPK